jgi:serine/threonine protein kinase
VFDRRLAFDPDKEIVMGATAAVHPADPILQAFGMGKLDDVSSASVSQHLEGCDSCQRRVAELSSDEFLGRIQQAGVMPDTAASGWSPSAGSSTDGTSGPVAPPPADTLPPELVDHPDWEIVRELGRGGMGVVYLANNRLMGRPEVLKVVGRHLIERPGVAERFLREIRSAGRLQHPNIVTAYSARQLGQSLVFAMEYVKGYDLSRLVKSNGPLPIAPSCHFIHQAALGLQHALENDMVHRDIKPANLIVREGKKGILKVLDFGLAKVTSEGEADSNLTREGQMVGTPDFIAPEQIRDAKSADIRADIYSLGCTLYYLLSGGPPFRGDHLWDVYQAHFSMEAGPLNLVRPEVPVELAAVVAKMMAKEPERRFQEPKQVAQALTPFFKKGSPGSAGSKPEVSQEGRTATDRFVSAPTQPAPNAGSSTARGEEIAKPTAAETKWESLINMKKDERSNNPSPAIEPDRRPPWKKWRIAMAGSLFGLIALGGIIITVLNKEGREILKVDVSDGETAVVKHSDGKGEATVPQKDRGGMAGNASSGPDAGGAGSVPAGKPTATLTDYWQPGTCWRGTNTQTHRSWTSNAGNPQNRRLTIKTRDGAHFTADLEQQNGMRYVEGTIRDGVIKWKVQDRDVSFEGKLVGNELAGTFKGSNWQGDWSGPIRLTKTVNLPTAELPTRIPRVGPLREPSYKFGGVWSVEGDELIKEGGGDGFVQFGDDDWTDYDLTYEVRRSAGTAPFGGSFRAGNGNAYTFSFDDPGDMHCLHRWLGAEGRAELIQSRPGTIQSLRWYAVKVSLLGKHIRVELDGQVIFDCWDDFSVRGLVALRFYAADGSGRFRNIKVTDRDGTTLWEGPPDLP